jgi:hypothetical protein
MIRAKCFLSFLIITFLPFHFAYALDVNEIVERADLLRRPLILEASFTMTLTARNGDKRVLKVIAYQKKIDENRENRLFLFTFPPSIEGTSLLVHSYLDSDDDMMWIFLPAVGKIKRVALDTSGRGFFMGSDFTYNDLLTTTLEEFNYKLQGEKSINGHDCHVIEVQGKTTETKKKYGYSRELHFIRKSDFALMKVIFYDLAGDLLKEFTVNEVRKIGKYLYPSNVRMENLQTRHTSEIIFDELGIPDDISDRYFTQRYLQNR